MRVAVLYYPEKRQELLKELSEALAKGLERQGHSVDVFNTRDFSRKLAIYQAVAIGTESVGFFGGKIPNGFSKYLASVGPLINLKTFAFVCNKGLRSQKSLLSLMKAMEAEGMFIFSSEIFENAAHAEKVSENLIIENSKL